MINEGTVHFIPPEILHEIFQRVLPPSELLDSTACLALEPTWNLVYQQKKSLTLVCRDWYSSAIPFLYQDICIFRIHQLRALLRSLESPGKQHYVKHIRLTAFVPGKYADTFHDLLGQLIQRSPSLVALDLTPGTELPLLSLPTPPNLTYLTLGPQIGPEIAQHVLRMVAPTLIRLSLHNFEAFNHVFPLLLELNVVDNHSGKIGILPGFLFPRLERATFVWAPPTWSLHNMRLHEFCVIHGQGLRMLQIQEPLIGGANFYKRDKDTDDYIVLQIALDLCPQLEHVVLHPHALRGTLQHKNIQWVDIWEPPLLQFPIDHSHPDRWGALKKPITKEAFPKLRGIRTFSCNLRPFHPTIPHVFPPTLCHEPGFSPFSIEFMGLHVRHEIDRVYSPSHERFDTQYDSDRGWGGEWDPECDNEGSPVPTEKWSEDESEDDEYVPPSSSEDEDDSSDDTSSTTTDDDDESDVGSAYLTEPDYDELLSRSPSPGI